MALRSGSEALARAIAVIGPERLPRFLTDSERRANDPGTHAAVTQSRSDEPRISRVSVTPEEEEEAEAGDEKPPSLPRIMTFGPSHERDGDPVIHGPQMMPTVGEAGPTASARPMPPLPRNPDSLLRLGWTEMTHPQAAANGHRTFRNDETGQQVRFDKGKPDETGYAAKDHYHVLNPDSSGKRDLYLNKDDEPVGKNDPASHLDPDD